MKTCLFGVLFFCIFANFSYAATPSVGSISPSSGSVTPNTAKTFTCKYSDNDGWANIERAYLLISTSSGQLTNSAYICYDQNANLLYLRDDADANWLGGYAPGSSNTIENSYVRLNCISSTVSGSSASMTVNFNITFKLPMSGRAYNTYLKVKDDAGSIAGWTKKGTYTINNIPVLGAVTPASGTINANTPLTITAAYSDPDGWQNIQYVQLLVSTSSTTYTNCLYAYYNQNTNLISLRNDANTGWLGGYEPGSANIIENSYASIDCATTSVSGTGTTLTIAWSIKIKLPFTGSKKTYLYAKDDLNAYANWAQKGALIISNSTPAIIALAPSSGSSATGQQLNFTTTFSDSNGWLNIDYVYFLINTSTGGSNCLYAKYSQNLDRIYLRNDANSAWLGGFSPGAENVIENSYAKLHCASTNVSVSGNTLTINWSVSFKTNFTGAKNCYLYIRDDAGAYVNFTKKGTWTILADLTPPTGSIQINGGEAHTNISGVTLALSAQDNPGGTGLSQMRFSSDNTTWSAPEVYAATKAWSLLPGDGEKTVYVKFCDMSGNWSQAYSDSIVLYSGTLIDPAVGGVVVSPDGKVRLTIPVGAFGGGPIPIYIVLANTSNSNVSVPQDYKLMVLVECKPEGLIFWKECQLDVTLAEEEVPGTPLELGYLINNAIELSLDSPRGVAIDGLHVQFPINHFSTYAGLSGMLSQGAPIGSGVQIPLPDMLTGAFGHSMPLTVPPGRKGMQPNVGIQYRSSGPNSWVGLGWSINPGYIVRSTKLGPPSYNDASDTFIFVTDSGSTEMVHLTDNLYQAKIEGSFAKFFKESDDSWKVVQKDGSILRFGQSANSKEITASGTSLWNLTRATDNNGNYLELTYIKDQGKAYLSRIDYTGNEQTGTSPTNTVYFILEDRTDVSSSFMSGDEVKLAKRLSEIQVKAQNDLVWSYIFTYDYSPDTNRSLLTSITQKSSDGKAFPPQTFKYQGSND